MNTLSEDVDELQRRGCTDGFNLKPHGLECPPLKLEMHPEDYDIDEFYRFEGISSTDDNSVVHAIFPKTRSKEFW